MLKRLISCTLIILLLCGCNSSSTNIDETTIETIDTESITTTVSTTETVTEMDTTTETTIDNTAIAEQLAQDLYSELDIAYDKCTTYINWISDGLSIQKSDKYYTIEDFCTKYSISNDFVYELNNYRFERYTERYPNDRKTINDFTQSFVHFYATYIFTTYAKDSGLFDEIQASLDKAKQIIQDIESLNVSLKYTDDLMDYYAKLNLFLQICTNEKQSYKEMINSGNEIKNEIELIKAKIDIYLS